MTKADPRRLGYEARFRLDCAIGNATVFRAMLQELSDLGLFPMTAQRLDNAAMSLLLTMKDSRAYASCPCCLGQPMRCEMCGVRGWITKLEYESLAPKPREDAKRL